jgi:hypothetical protein
MTDECISPGNQQVIDLGCGLEGRRDFSDAGLGAAARHPPPATENLHTSRLMRCSK